jgi:hypothetical protein
VTKSEFQKSVTAILGETIVGRENNLTLNRGDPYCYLPKDSWILHTTEAIFNRNSYLALLNGPLAISVKMQCDPFDIWVVICMIVKSHEHVSCNYWSQRNSKCVMKNLFYLPSLLIIKMSTMFCYAIRVEIWLLQCPADSKIWVWQAIWLHYWSQPESTLTI